MFGDELAFKIQQIGKTLPRYKLKEIEASKTNFIMVNSNESSVYCRRHLRNHGGLQADLSKLGFFES